MKVCESCGEEIFTKDGENQCADCENKSIKRRERTLRRNAREQAMLDLGLTKARGDLGGIYWE